MVATTQAVIPQVVTQTRVEINKYVKLAYVAPGQYVVEFHRNGRVHYTKYRSQRNRWVLYLYLHTRPVMFSGDLRVWKE